jgi:hypothetical protein
MKNSDKVISSKNLPARLPLWTTILMWLVLERLNAPGWVWGVVGTIFVVLWIGAITLMIKQESVDIFEGK